MKASELIEKVKELMKKHGDLEIRTFDSGYDWGYRKPEGVYHNVDEVADRGVAVEVIVIH